jgi:hypothetical protein
MSLMWATRGRRWGFRFLETGGHADPLLAYDAAFGAIGDDRRACSRSGDVVALRFPDPLGRRDAAGRVIPHEFVVTGDLAAHIHTVEDGIAVVWPLVADRYAEVWDGEGATRSS